MSQQGQSQRPGGGGGGDVNTLKGNSGGFVGPDGGGNINVIGDGITVSVAGNPGTNTLTISSSGDVAIDFTADDANVATPAGNNLNVLGGPNINTSVPVPNGDTFNVNLNTSIDQPVTNSSGTEGLYSLGGNRFLHAYGVGIGLFSNAFLGRDAGNLSIIGGRDNTGVGTLSLNALVSGTHNSSFGSESQQNVTTGGNNSSIGYQSLSLLTVGTFNNAYGAGSLLNLLTGDANICVGSASGAAFMTNESSNIIIGNPGTILDNNTTRIGTQGNGLGQQDKAFIAGIYNTTPASATTQVAIIDANGQLGSSRGNDGQILIGQTGGTGSPAWANITSLDGTIEVDNGANTIDLSVTGGFNVFTVTTNNAVATPIFTQGVAANSAITVIANVVAAKSDFSESLFGTAVIGARRVAGGAILVDIPNINFGDDAAGVPALTADVSGNNVRLLVTGELATTWNWTANITAVVQT